MQEMVQEIALHFEMGNAVISGTGGETRSAMNNMMSIDMGSAGSSRSPSSEIWIAGICRVAATAGSLGSSGSTSKEMTSEMK